MDCKCSIFGDDSNAHRIMLGMPCKKTALHMSRYRQEGRGCESIWRPLHFYACYMRILIILNTFHTLSTLYSYNVPNHISHSHTTCTIFSLYNIQPVQVQNPASLFLTSSTKPSVQYTRGGADMSLARPTSRCRRTKLIVSLERRVC